MDTEPTAPELEPADPASPQGEPGDGAPATAETPPESPSMPLLAPPAHGGGLLYRGGVPGNKGALAPRLGAGAVRDACRLAFTERIPVLEQIADGAAVQHYAVSLKTVLQHAHCPKCDGTLRANSKDRLRITLPGKVSATPYERVRAIDTLGKYGLDARTQLAVEDVKERLRATLATIRDELARELGPERGQAVAERIIGQIRGGWAA